jgi:hypothetical protein
MKIGFGLGLGFFVCTIVAIIAVCLVATMQGC